MTTWHLQLQAMRKRKAIRRRKLHATNVENLDIKQMNVMKWTPLRDKIQAKKGSNFLVLKEDINDSSLEGRNGIVSTFNEEEELQMSDDDKNALPDEENDDEDEETDEETDEENEDTDDKDNYNKYTDTDVDYEGFAFLQNDVMCYLQDKAGILASWILLDSQLTVDYSQTRNC